MDWFYGGSNLKSIAELDKLVKNVILHEDFKVNHLEGFSAARGLQQLNTPDKVKHFSMETGWKESSVYLHVPVKNSKEDDAPQVTVHGVWHCTLVDVIRTALEDPRAQSYHLTPFRMYWKPTEDSKPERTSTIPTCFLRSTKSFNNS